MASDVQVRIATRWRARPRKRSSTNTAIAPSVSNVSGRKKTRLSAFPRTVGILRALHRAQERVQVGIDQLQHHVRIEAEEERQRRQRVEGEPLPPVQVG